MFLRTKRFCLDSLHCFDVNMIKSFQGLRLIALAGIVMGHLGNNWIGGGVELCTFFFILSGFLFKPSNLSDYFGYVKRKFSKIFPVYWFCLFLYLLLSFFRENTERSKIGWDILPHLFLVQSWIPTTDMYAMKYLGLAWFLSSLLFCYLLAPFLYRSMYRSKWSIIIYPILLVFCRRCATLTPDYYSWISYICPLVRAFELAIGMGIGIILRDNAFLSRFRRIPVSSVLNGTLGILAVMMWMLSLHYGWLGDYYWLSHLCVLSILLLFPSNFVNAILGNRIVLAIASHNMFIYLSHAGIGFHIMFHFFTTNTLVVCCGSFAIGCCIGFLYDKLRTIKRC